MDKIKTYYCNMANAGDMLTKEILYNIFNKKIVYSTQMCCDLLAIGSIIEALCIMSNKSINYNVKIKIKEFLASKSHVFVWSSGFMCQNNSIPIKFIRNNVTFTALRGKLSKEIVEKHFFVGEDIVLADGGLLSSLVTNSKNQKKYNIGIVPHWTELNNLHILKLKDYYPNSIFVDITKNPLEVIKNISSCEFILSSSLHGLIIADSFNIPNMPIVVSEEIKKSQPFKYKDYYSSFNLSYKPIDLFNNDTPPSINQIIDNYKINFKDVLIKQQQLIDVFPFK